MPEPIYAKFTDYRNDRFRVVTRILKNDDGSCIVTKENGDGADAKGHLENIARAHDLLENLHIEGVDVCPCTWDGTRVIFPYIPGTSYQKTLDKAVASGDRAVMREAFRRYLAILEGPASNSIPFASTPEFEQIFGSPLAFEGLEALRVSNLDASGDNLLFSDAGRLVLVDYEWVLPFPVPRDFVIYRNLRVMYEAHWVHRIRFDTLLDLCGVSTDRPLLTFLDNAFDAYVTIEPDGTPSRTRILQERTMDFLPAGNIFRRTDHYIFLDTGNGFNESEKLLLPARGSDLLLRIDVSGARAVRFDPYGGARCILRGVRCIANTGEELPIEPVFASGDKENMICETPANLHIRIPKGVRSIEITGSAGVLESEKDAGLPAPQNEIMHTEFSDESQSSPEDLLAHARVRDQEIRELRAALHNAREETARAKSEAAAARSEKDLAHEALEDILSSKSWRYTKWLRSLRGSIPKKT